MPPCVLFEDEHLLVVNKPAGWNTHAPSPFAGEGIYDWLKHREPRWGSLAIIHRLDKETSGVMVFGKTALANRSLTEQFTKRSVRKKYLLLTDRPVRHKEFVVKTALVRAGEKYVSRSLGERGQVAETRFKSAVGDEASSLILECEVRGAGCEMKSEPPHVGCYRVEAEPLTGRTHQIRVHAAESGFPILGDTLYGGTPAVRLYLHATELSFKHPATGEAMTLRAPVDFAADPCLALRAALFETCSRRREEAEAPVEAGGQARLLTSAATVLATEPTDAFRLMHGASDGWRGWYVDRLGNFLLSQSEQPLSEEQKEWLKALISNTILITHDASRITGAYHKILSRQVRRATAAEASPQLVLGEPGAERFTIREHGVQFELSFNEGYSVGLFLDQRDNRRRFLTGHVAAEFSLASNPPRTPPRRGAAQSHSNESSPPLEVTGVGSGFSSLPLTGMSVLNTFAYTCGFSVCAALAGGRVTSLDLSKKYLEWGKRNFALNGLDHTAHDFIYGDVFDWLKRLAKKGRAFDVVVLDPPTFSQSKEHGVFRAEKDYGKLAAAALSVLKPGGVLFASTNAADWPPEKFVADVEESIRVARRKILQRHYVPQPPDFPVSRAEPAYLKAVWLRVT